MRLTTDELLSLAAGELMAFRREPLTLTCPPKRPTLNRKPKWMKFRNERESLMLSQTSELDDWLNQVLPPTSVGSQNK
ncbi:MAG TPA: hypothetical protein VJS11_02515 [Acidobacteriaceae bacterium]|nr:hypothetical protein [Acidobacteriaceae bacterium]